MIFLLKQKYGFSLIEVILVLLLIGILGSLVVNRITSIDVETAGGRAVIKSHIRYSQLLAMKSNRVCGIEFKGSEYSIFRNGSTVDTIVLPNNNTATHPIASSIGSATETIYFDSWGTPYSNAIVTTPRPAGAIGSLGITMAMDTGYVQ